MKMQFLSSIQTRIVALLSVIFSLVLFFSLWHSLSAQKSLVEDVVTRQASDAAAFYFDSINTMMLTGTMNNRGLLSKKMLLQPNVREARILRGEGITKIFGDGEAGQLAQDDLDRRALAGESVHLIKDTDNGRELTIIEPMKNGKDIRGVNCMMCHITPDGETLGAVRVTYALEELDKKVSANLWENIVGNGFFTFAGLFALIFSIRRWVMKPLRAMGQAFDQIRNESDLSKRIEIHREDEIGLLAHHFNQLQERFSESIHHVSSSTDALSNAADELQFNAQETRQAVDAQTDAVNEMNEAIEEVEKRSEGVKKDASKTAQASKEADEEANRGKQIIKKTISGIQDMMQQINRSSGVIESLDEKSRNVGSVLDVIKGIAEQTNLLALNAAIEAARAGESGRGFAVVADEVRSLAIRTQESTGEIESLIEILQHETKEAVSNMNLASEKAENGVELAAETSAALEVITSKVSNISILNEQMAHAASRQSESMRAVSNNVISIRDMASMTESHSENAAALSLKLVELSNQLDENVSTFKLD